MLKIGLIGAGRIGQLHARNIIQNIENAQLKSVTDVFEKAAHLCAESLGIPEVVASHEEMLADSELDAVLICSSTDTHAQFIIDAANAGKHIFCEKPIAFDVDEIDRALEAVEKAGVKLQIGFNRRFDSNAQRIKAGLDAGEIGEPHRLHIISRDPSPPPAEYVKRSGGMFVDMTIHDFDMARFLMGCEAEEIYTMAGVMINPEFEALGDVDTAVIVMRFENGAMVTIDNSRQAVYGYDQRMEVFGSGGSLESSNQFAHRVVSRGAEHLSTDKPLHFFLERYHDSFIKEMQSFVDAVLNDTEVPVNGNDGRVPVLMGLAAKKSIEENRPVKMTELQ